MPLIAEIEEKRAESAQELYVLRKKLENVESFFEGANTGATLCTGEYRDHIAREREKLIVAIDEKQAEVDAYYWSRLALERSV